MVQQQDIPSAAYDHGKILFARDFFDLQFAFAERVSALSGIPLAQALFEYTNLYIRFGLGRNFDQTHDGWRAYVDGLRNAEDGREWTYRFYLNNAEANTAPSLIATFGCFSYGFKERNILRLHFHNTEPAGCSPLGTERDAQRRGELADLFAHVKSEVSGNPMVAGVSWLYNLHAYRRLFPPAYGASARPLHGLFRSMPLWGQFLNHRGEVKTGMSGGFLEAIGKEESVAGLGRCFPFQVLAVETLVQAFYRFYGV